MSQRCVVFEWVQKSFWFITFGKGKHIIINIGAHLLDKNRNQGNDGNFVPGCLLCLFPLQVNLLADDGELLLADLEAVSGWLRLHRNQTSLIPGVSETKWTAGTCHVES